MREKCRAESNVEDEDEPAKIDDSVVNSRTRCFFANHFTKRRDDIGVRGETIPGTVLCAKSARDSRKLGTTPALP